MARAVTCLRDGVETSVEEVLRLRDAPSAGEVGDLRCIECREAVRAHKAGGASEAHFEHIQRNRACRLSDPNRFDADSATHEFIEFLTLGNEMIRVTYIPESWAGQGGVRIQVRNSNGHLNQGPEIPLQSVGDLVGAITDLLRPKT
jgi:hypothetical protein